MVFVMVDLLDLEIFFIMNIVLDDFMYVIVFGFLRNGKFKQGFFAEIVIFDKDEISEFIVGFRIFFFLLEKKNYIIKNQENIFWFYRFYKKVIE